LCDERKIVFVADFELRNIVGRLDQIHSASRLAHRALDLGMAAMTDHDDFAPGAAHLGDLDVHFGHQRTGRIEYFSAHASASRRTACDTPCALNMTVLPAGTSLRFSTNTAPFERRSSTTNYCARLHGARRSARRESAVPLDDVYGAVNAGAKAAGFGKQDLHGCLERMLIIQP
jgi:hypothetical protein